MCLGIMEGIITIVILHQGSKLDRHVRLRHKKFSRRKRLKFREYRMMNPIKINPTQPEPDALHTPYKGSDKEFTGDVTLKRLVWAGDSAEVELLGVWFSAGARTKPHIHDVDQVLHVLEGTCAYGDENGVILVPAGEIFTVPKNVWHWHGATPDAPMMHLSIRKMGNSTNWEVEEKNWASQYAKLQE